MSYTNPWRPTYEAYSAAAWSASALTMTGMAAASNLPSSPFLYMAAASSGFALFRGNQTWNNWQCKAALSGRNLPLIKASELWRIGKSNPDQIYLGKGFIWQQEHTQRLYEVRKLNLKDVEPPWLYRTLRDNIIKLDKNFTHDPNPFGQSWIHGLEPVEYPIGYEVAASKGHTLAVGTTGSGKTRLLEVLGCQSIHRGDVVIVFDPKNDEDLQKRYRKECKRLKRPFLFIHPAFPELSVRLDPLKNWTRPTEIASRLAALIPSEDSFSQFAWLSISRVVNAMALIENRPTLKKIKDYVQNGVEFLLERLCEKILREHMPQFESMVSSRMTDKKRFPTILEAMIDVYETEVKRIFVCQELDDLVSMFRHDRDHYNKMILNLLPIISMLTSGGVGEILSPDPDDIDDPRPIYDMEKIINQGAVIYVALDSLSDTTVGSAIGSMLLADLAAVAGSRYNFGMKDVEVSIYVDEAAEVVNQQFIQILNKGRGAKYKVTFLTQTIADFEARMGSKSRATMMLGNANNLIALRVVDVETQRYITEKFGKTHIKTFSMNQTMNAASMDDVTNYKSGIGKSMSETEVAVVPGDILGKLPNLQFIALVAGGTLIKGRVPIITD